VAACILAFLSFRSLNQPRPLPPSSALPVMIDIQGEVRHPDRYALPGPTATLGEALRAAGGLTGDGTGPPSQEVLNQPIVSGTLVRVQRSASGELQFQTEQMPASTRLVLGMKLDLNAASLDDLLCVPQMKPETARAIVERRNQRRWRDLHELNEIPGVGPRTVEKWRSHLSFE
jgi:DNA uptake protein ComE-like DNA-binding protein